MMWRNGFIGIELMATVSLSAFYGISHLKRRADAFDLTAPCVLRAGCPSHPIAVRSPKFGRALLATSAIGGLLTPYAVLTGKTGRAGMAAALTAAGSLVLALGLRYEFVRVDDERQKADNAKAGIVTIGSADDEDDFLDDADCRDDDRYSEWSAAAA